MQISEGTSGRIPLPQSIEELRGRNDPEAVKAAAREMESLFAYELIKAMRGTAGAPLKGGLGANTYMSMFDMELARLFADRGLGLQDMLLKRIEQKTSPLVKDGVGAPMPRRTVRTTGAASVSEHEAEALQESFPESGGKISSGFGMRHDPFTGALKFHHGLDVAAPEGSEIKPIKQGKVIFSGEQPGYGNVVVIDHGDGFITKYAHNQVNQVQEGDEVLSSTVIARVGNTGRSTGPHTHFEVLYMGKDIDPISFLGKK